MGSLEDPKLIDLHEQINQAIQWWRRRDWASVGQSSRELRPIVGHPGSSV